MDRIAPFRKQYALDVGFVLPKVRIRDVHTLEPNALRDLHLRRRASAGGELLADRTLAIHPRRRRAPGAARRRRRAIPTYGLPAVWIDRATSAQPRATRGYTLVDPATVSMTHLTEVLRAERGDAAHARRDRAAASTALRQQQPALVDELIPQVLSLGDMQKVLQNLLREKVSIRNLEAILEVLADAGAPAQGRRAADRARAPAAGHARSASSSPAAAASCTC